MQTVINYFAGLDKTTVKQFVTVVGVIVFFALVVAIIVLVAFNLMEAATTVAGYMIAVAIITGVVGKDVFLAAAV
jgi:hypothetical protein